MTGSDVVVWVEMPGLLYELIARETDEQMTVEEGLAEPRNLKLTSDATDAPAGTIHADGAVVV